MKPLESGTIIQGRYLIKDLIGKGGMGQVYLAVDQRLGHSVALKRTTVGDDVSLTEAFENEAKTLAQLRHPYLPKVSDHFVDEDEQFLVMEYIGGDDLAQRLKTLAKPFPLNWVLFWADELLETLHYLHTHDPPILHRDIKPQNLKLTGDNHIVLLDFGLSKHSVGQTRITTSGSVVGYTPHYAPMEQIRGTGTSALSDLYALSATLYHLLSNRVPPDALTRADTMIGGNPDPIRQLTELNGEVSEVISDAIMKGMELSQDKRFPSAREMQKTLRKAYNELQKSMSADTVAFNVNDALGEDSFAGDKTEVMAGLAPGSPEPGASSLPDADKTEVIDAAQMREMAGSASPPVSKEDEEVNFDKTEVMSEFPVLEKDEAVTGSPVPPVPSVFDTSDDIDDAAYPATGEYKTSEDIGSDEFKTNEDVHTKDLPDSVRSRTGQDDAAPVELDATVPFIALERNAVSAAADEEAEEDAEEDFGFTGEYSAAAVSSAEPEEMIAEREPVSIPTAVPAEPGGGSSTGKYVAILLGLGAVLVLLFGSALGIGWYYYSGGFGGGDQTPVPTPVTTPSVEETPFETPAEATPELTPEASPENTASPEASPESTIESTPGRTPSATPRRTPSRTPGKTPAATPVKTPPPTPRPTPKKTPRTLPTILQ
jgi:serine/threonine protein kinase